MDQGELKVAKKKAATKKVASRAKKSAGAKRRPREKDNYFTGMEPLSIKAIDDAAEEYELAKEERMEASVKEVEAKNKLKEIMEQHSDQLQKNAEGWPSYHARSIQRVVTLEAVEMTVKVKKEKAPPTGDE